MLISSWNVNGLRSASISGFKRWLDEVSPDFLCLQETKMKPDMLTSTWFDGYLLEIFPARKNGYSGTGVMYRRDLKPKGIEFGIGCEEFDLEGRVVSTFFDHFEIINIYAPHSHRKLINLDKKIRFLTALMLFLKRRKAETGGKPIILAGDFNVAFEDRDLFHCASNRGNAGCHDAERTWFGELLEVGFVDALRELTSDGGIYSWWSQLPGVKERNVGWRLDYVLVDSRLRDRIQECTYSKDALGSDHCPVSVSIDLSDYDG